MYFQDYLIFLGAILVCMAFSAFASFKVRSTFNKFSRVPTRSGKTGYDTANILMSANNINDISIGRIKGNLSDHFHPANKIVNLSESTYASSSVAAVAVAAHEMGHVMQSKSGYAFYKVRTAIVPIVNFGSYLAMPLVLIGLILNLLVETIAPSIGFYIALVGVALYGGSLVFALVTLPVELNASRRAKKMLVETGILEQDEVPGASKVLSAAALTYLASLLISLVYFLRFFLYVLTIFGRRD